MNFIVFLDWVRIRERTRRDAAWLDIALSTLQRCGVTGVVFGIASKYKRTTPVWKSSWTDTEIERAVGAVRQYGMSAHLMFWAHRHGNYLTTACADMRRLVICAGADGVVLDCESEWHRGNYDATNAAQLVSDILWDTPWAVAGLGICQPSVKPIARLSPLSVPMALSIRHPSNPRHFSRIDRNKRFLKPPELQARCHESWTRAGAQNIELELATYWLKREDMRPESVFDAQLKGATEAGCSRVWLWSGKWLLRDEMVMRRVRESALGEIG